MVVSADRYQCEHCGEVPISGDCPHGCHERKVVAWRNGKYLYCLSHSTSQVIQWEQVYKGDTALDYGNRKCDWCRRKLA